MGWIQELEDLISKLKFFEIVYEYQQGLYFRAGNVLALPVRRSKKEWQEIYDEERRHIQEKGGLLNAIRKNQELPKEFTRGIFGIPVHVKRHERDKVLRPGLYFLIPIVDDIVTESKQERVLNLGNISVPTIEDEPHSKVVLISCNLRYEIMDLYRAYTAIDDFEDSLKDHTLSILAFYSRGKTYSDWKNPKTIEKLEQNVLDELRKIVTEKWGLKIHKVYITDYVSCNVQRISYEGRPVLAKDKVESDLTVKI